jgi:hypothetical protein
MARSISRRAFLVMTPAAGLVPALGSPTARPAAPSPTGLPESFPSQDPAVVREMVTVAHGNVGRVRELVEARPALARASWDWGFGDWETALGAASHMGNREIAEYLIAHGARPTIFSAAMLGQADVVKAFVSASPGVQRIRGPHGITLVAHAKAGGTPAAEVVRYLESLGDADPRYPVLPLADSDQAALVGSYAFGEGPTDRLVVARSARGDLTIRREGAIDRTLFHLGSRTFNPAGAEAVRVRFELDGDRASMLTVEDGGLIVKARRLSA